MKRLALVGMLFAGCSDTSNVGFTSKRDVFTSPRWTLTLGGSRTEGAGAAAFDPAGDLIVTGGFNGTVDFGNAILQATTAYASWISKRAGADGTERWTVAIGAVQAPAAIADLAVLPDGSFVVIGDHDGDIQLGSTTLSGTGCFLAKLDGGGNFLWARSIGATAQCTRLAVGPDGRIAIVGWYTGTITLPGGAFTARDHDTFLLSLDPTGTPQWGVTTPNVGMTNGVLGLSATGLAIAPSGPLCQRA